MKKNYFFASLSVAFLTLTSVCSIQNNIGLKFNNKNEVSNNLNLNPSQYLILNNEKGEFFSWNKSSDKSENSKIGIFNSNSNSYLVNNVGNFTNLFYKVKKFFRITDIYGIATFENYKNKTNKSYLVTLNSEKNNLVVKDEWQIATENQNFTIIKVKEFNSEISLTIAATGNGLQIIEINLLQNQSQITIKDIKINEDQNNIKKSKEEKRELSTWFFTLNSSKGIYIGQDNCFYLVNNININPDPQIDALRDAEKNKIIASWKYQSNSIIKINENEFLIRDWLDIIYKYDLKANRIKFLSYNKKSLVKNYATRLTDNYFLMSLSDESNKSNSSSSYGVPTIFNFIEKSFKKLSGIDAISDAVVIENKNAEKIKLVIRDEKNIASIYEINPEINKIEKISIIGEAEGFQYVNSNIGMLQNNEQTILFLLNNEENNLKWEIQNSILFTKISPSSKLRFLNSDVFTAHDKLKNWRNSYISDGPVSLDLNFKSLKNVTITPENGDRIILFPVKNSINYSFIKYNNYEMEIKYFNKKSKVEDYVNYRIIIKNFEDNWNKAIKILPNNSITPKEVKSYLGYVDNKLLDVLALPNYYSFSLSSIDFQSVEKVEKVSYSSDKLAIKSIETVFEKTNFAYTPATINFPNFVEEEGKYGLKITNLLGEVKWIYLAFENNSQYTIPRFWNTQEGKSLYKNALNHNYTSELLKKMSAAEVKELMLKAANWYNLDFSGKIFSYIMTIVLFIASFFSFVAVLIYYHDKHKK